MEKTKEERRRRKEEERTTWTLSKKWRFFFKILHFLIFLFNPILAGVDELLLFFFSLEVEKFIILLRIDWLWGLGHDLMESARIL
jgi:hypothetical protein